MHANNSGDERVILVHLSGPNSHSNDLEEFVGLVEAAGADIKYTLEVKKNIPHAKYYIGTGKFAELQQLVTTYQAELVIFNTALTPAQERNLERDLKCRVIDRTGLILDIFAQRARTYEGKLQVELAQLEYQSTRLIRGWTHLERQKGGIGMRGGPGETQLEIDRRLIRQRIQYIKTRLERVKNQRLQGRRARNKANLPTIALVGYTNAGKSTLFNTLTGANTLAANMLFATLDPTLRTMELSKIGKIVVADTVGFVSNLPHDLVEAFRATLEEVREANVLIHVINVAQEGWREQQAEVLKVLEQISALNVPRIDVYNKIDALNTEILPHADSAQGIKRVWLSALSGQGIELLKDLIVQELAVEFVSAVAMLPFSEQKLRALLFENGVVEQEEIIGTEIKLTIYAPLNKWQQLCHQYPILRGTDEDK